MTKGRSIKMFLADGVPGGIITAEIMNWTGHVMFGPRSRLVDLIKRDEAKRTGVYFLTGEDPEGGYKPVVYIGETDNVGKRLTQHNKDENKDFWDRVCVVTSKDQNLTKAHVKYLESRLIAITGGLGRAKLFNGNAPEYSQLPEADLSDMEFFIDQIRIVLPVLGRDFDFLRETIRHSEEEDGSASDNTYESPDNIAPLELTDFELFSRRYGINAQAREYGGEFIVLKGSTAQAKWIGVDGGYQSLHNQLITEDILIPNDETEGLAVFKKDHAFRSPSAASAVILGRPDNGRTSWKVKGTGGKTYAEWQEEKLASVDTEEDNA